MKGTFIATILAISALSMGNAQTINFGDSTSLIIGNSSSLFVGGNTTFNGTVQNQGEIISYSDLDFTDNQVVGSLKFVGDTDQNLVGDTIVASNIEVDKQGDVNLQTDRVFVTGMLDVTAGVIQAEELDDLIVTGESDDQGRGYVEGRLVGITSSNPVTFPMGLNGFANYITFSGTEPDKVVVVDVRQPDPATLLPTEEMVGIADEVEWAVAVAGGDSTDALVTVNFSGLDFVNFSNGQAINADAYEPAIVFISQGDTVYNLLRTSDATPQNGNTTSTTGSVESSGTVRLSSEPIRISIAWIPVIDGPEFFVPNSFSPSGFYEENRVFRPFFAGGQVSSVLVSVYNAYNDQIYQHIESGTDLDLGAIGWDGRLRTGQDAPEGVYYYTIRLIAEAQAFQKTGTVLLVR